MDPVLHQLMQEIEAFPEAIQDLPVTQPADPKQVREAIESCFDLSKSEPLESLMKKVVERLRQWNVHATHPRYFGLFSPCSKRASVVGDALSALYNPQLAGWNSSPFANELERFTLEFLAMQIGLEPESTCAHFTTGGAESNLTAVVAALTHAIPGFDMEGLGSRRPVFYLSADGHGSFDKIAHTTGLGRKAARRVPTDAEGRLDNALLVSMIQEDRKLGLLPFMVVATVGTTSTGAIDPLLPMSQICCQEGLWLHVDAAWGGSAVLSPRLRPYVAGIERADSLSWDAAKWLAVSMGAGMFFSRHPQSIADAFRVEVPYATNVPPGQAADPYKTTLQWSRRFIGLKVFLTLAEIGLPDLRVEIDRMTDLGNVLREELVRGGWHVLNSTPLPLVCFSHPLIEQRQMTVQEVLKNLYGQGEGWISSVLLRGKTPALRACITHYASTEQDVKELVSGLTQIVTRRGTGSLPDGHYSE